MGQEIDGENLFAVSRRDLISSGSCSTQTMLRYARQEVIYKINTQ